MSNNIFCIISGFASSIKKRGIIKESHFSSRDNIDFALTVCLVHVMEAIRNVANADSVAACKNHRLCLKEINRYGSKARRVGETHKKFPEGIANLFESTEKIAEIARRMACIPGFQLPVSAKCELLTILDDLQVISVQSTNIRDLKTSTSITKGYDARSGLIKQEISFIKDLTSVNSQSISITSLKSDPTAFTYILLLNNLRHFLSAISEVCHFTENFT